MIAPICIYLLLPAIGTLAYYALIWRMRNAQVKSPPTAALFILFFTLGGWIQVILTAEFWEWSGMASIGVLYLILFAPIVLGVLAVRLRSETTLSRYHKYAFWISAAYPWVVFAGVPLSMFALRHL